MHWTIPGIVMLILAGCAGSRRNPFVEPTGPITLVVLNFSRASVQVSVERVLDGEEETVELGIFHPQERRSVNVQWKGDGRVRAVLSHPGGMEQDQTFPRQAVPGDCFELVIDRTLHRSRLVHC